MQQILEFSFARVLVRLTGIVLIVWGTYHVAGAVVYGIGMQLDASGMPMGYMLAYVASTGVPGLAVIALGLFFACGGNAVARLLVRGMHGRCRVCGYDIRSTPGPTCPECDAPIARERKAADGSTPPTDLRV